MELARYDKLVRAFPNARLAVVRLNCGVGCVAVDMMDRVVATSNFLEKAVANPAQSSLLSLAQ